MLSRSKGRVKVCQIPGTGKWKKVKWAIFKNDVNHGHIKLKGVGMPLAQIQHSGPRLCVSKHYVFVALI